MGPIRSGALMTGRFEGSSRTPLGQRLAPIAAAPARHVEYRALSREWLPAVLPWCRPELEAAGVRCGQAVRGLGGRSGHAQSSTI